MAIRHRSPFEMVFFNEVISRREVQDGPGGEVYLKKLLPARLKTPDLAASESWLKVAHLLCKQPVHEGSLLAPFLAEL